MAEATSKLYKRLDFGSPFDFDQVQFGQNCSLVYHDNFLVEDEGNFMSTNTGIIIIAILSAIYLPIIFLIFKNRHMQAVYFKSPYLILWGSLALYLDSICNVYLSLVTSSPQVCFLSILDTFTMHYISYFAMVFRAHRIFKVMQLESRYLDQIYAMGGLLLDSSSKEGAKGAPKENLDVARQKGLDLDKEQLSLQAEMQKCREKRYLKYICWIVTPMALYTLLAYFYPMPFFIVVPIFRSSDCRVIQWRDGNDIVMYQITINNIMFLLFNWAELAYLYYTWMKLRHIEQDQLNIKNEIKFITFWWILFSFLYFFVSLVPRYEVGETPPKSYFQTVKFSIMAGCLGILLRNLAAFLTQTLMTLHQVYFKKKIDYSNDFLKGKITVLNIDVIMSHQLTFQKFKQYIEDNFQESQIYLSLYCLIKIYKKQLKQLRALQEKDHSMQQSSCSRNTTDSINLCEDKNEETAVEPPAVVEKKSLKRGTQRATQPNQHEQGTRSSQVNHIEMTQVMVGQKMIEILQFISDYYEQYFRGLKVLNLQFNPDTLSSNHLSIDTSRLDDANDRSADEQSAPRSQSPEKISLDRAPTQQNLRVFYELNWLEQYPNIVDIPSIRSQIKQAVQSTQGSSIMDPVQIDQIIYHPPLSFEPFLDLSRNHLESIFQNNFKQDKQFTKMLMDICKAETRVEFLERVDFIKKDKHSSSSRVEKTSSMISSNIKPPKKSGN